MAALIDAGAPHRVAEVEGAFAGYAYASGHRWTVEDSVHLAPAFAGCGDGDTRPPDGV
jgi:phosphinothricin acetyltransferase